MEYLIFHIDMDSFFASVEESKNKNYFNKPLVVGGRNKRGVVASANYIARSYGIKSAMPIIEALKLCPKLIVTDVCFEDYNYFSFEIYKILKSITNKVEIGSIDEWYISLENTIYESWKEEEFAYFLKKQILEKYNLKCTIGCSWNKVFAKMATNLNKPNGYGIINKENFQNQLYQLDVSKMPFVGKNTTNILKEYNINKIGDIVTTKKEVELFKRIGVNWLTIKQNALGNGSFVINKSNEPKSIGRSHSIEETFSFNDYKKLFEEITISLNNSLLEGNFCFNNITLKIKYRDKQIQTINIKNLEDLKYVNANILVFEFDNNINQSNYDNIKNIAVTLWPIKRNIFNIKQLNMFNQVTNDLDSIISKINNDMNKKVIYKASELSRKFYKPSK